MNISKIYKAIKNIRHHTLGRCNICGNYTVFICSNILTARNNMMCLFCGSSSRKRHVASLIIDKLFRDIKSISQIASINTNIHIYNVALDDPFSKYLSKYKYYYSSEYLPGITPGSEIRNKVYCQNVEETTFDSAAFDLVITEDVFEHVRNCKKGFLEIHRILKPGGYHIFTVPCYFDRKTIVRVDTSGEIDVNLLPAEYHGDPVRGNILAYRTFGIDIFGVLKTYGFSTELFISKYIDKNIGIFDSYVFVSKKLE